MSDYRDQQEWERYYQKLHRFFGNPEKFGETLDLLGNPKDAAEFHAALVRIVQRQERWEWLFGLVKMSIGALITVGAAVIMIRDVLPIILRWLTGIAP